MGKPEPDGCGAAVLLRRDPRPGGGPGADRLCPGAAPAAGGAERGRGDAVPRGGAEPEGAGGADDRLRRRAARLGGHRPSGERHRQRAHADPRRERQGRQGALRHAVGAAARHPADLLAARPPGTLAVPGTGCRPADRADGAARGLPHSPGGGGHRQEGDGACPSAQLRDAPAGERRRHPGDPGAARPCPPLDDGALHPRLAGHHRPDREPARAADAGGGSPPDGWPPWPAAWRWRTSSAATVPDGAPNRPGISTGCSAG